MDVELLRPGTVPANPDSVLWFEFLLDPELLEKHFNKLNPDPSPGTLVVKFLTTSLEPSEDGEYHAVSDAVPETITNGSSRRQSLKILAVKIFALWKFDLDVLQAQLPICLQNTLLRELISATSSSADSIPPDGIVEYETTTDEYLFSLSLYHRWVLRTLANALEFKQIRINATQGNLTEIEELLSYLECRSGQSEQFLKSVSMYNKASGHIIVPTSKCFTALSEQNIDTHRHDFVLGHKLDFQEFVCQMLFDLCNFQISVEDYVGAKDSIGICKRIFESYHDKQLSEYCKVTAEEINGFCEAIGEDVADPSCLELALLDSINNDYRNVIGILQQDNLKNEIPLSARISLELEVTASLSTGKFSAARDLLFQIQTLNAIRQAPYVSGYATKLCSVKKGVDILVWALTPVLKSASQTMKNKLELFLLTLLELCDLSTVQNLVKQKEVSSFFTSDQISEILAKKNINLSNVEQTPILRDNLWNSHCEKNTTTTNTISTERKLISSFKIEEIKQCIYVLGSTNKQPMWNFCKKWQLPIPLQSVIMNLPAGFMQQLSFVLLAKARELNDLQDYVSAQQLVRALDVDLKKQAQNSVLELKLQQLIAWESLQLSINRLLQLWPTRVIDTKKIVNQAQECLASFKSNDSHVIPRIEIVETCCIALLNLMEWHYLSNSPLAQRFVYMQLCSSLSVACIEMDKFKGNKKFSRDLWDVVVPIFAMKRKHGNYGGPPIRESNISVLQLTQFLSRLRDDTSIIVMTTLFVRLYNILRDEQGVELNIEWMNLWPSMLPGHQSLYVNNRTPDTVLEILSTLLIDALKLDPSNVHYLKLLGDTYFVNRHYGAAMKYYILSIISVTEYFSRLNNRLVDNHVYRRMIKCCIHLQCYTQAAVLCQFLEEVDYATAFKSLSEENFCSDAMDSYYECVWDMNILEYLVYLHHKRNEYVRKQQAINIIGLLELNSNNNEEIKREAANKRKTKFLQSLASQYVG